MNYALDILADALGIKSPSGEMAIKPTASEEVSEYKTLHNEALHADSTGGSKWTHGFFPIYGADSTVLLPWEMVEPYRAYLWYKWGNTLEQIAESGGLDYYELYCLLTGWGVMDYHALLFYNRGTKVRPEHAEYVNQMITKWWDDHGKETD